MNVIKAYSPLTAAKRNSQNRSNSHKYKDESEIIRIEGGCPAIVSEKLWERANAARKLAASLATRAKTTYLLSGLLYCGECGAKMHGNRRTYNGRVYNTYKCNRRGNNLTCSCKEIRTDILEGFVIDSLTSHFFNPEVIDMITEEINRQIHEATQNEREDIQLAKSSLKGLELARGNLIDAIAQTGFNPSLSDKLGNIEKQIAEHKTLIAEEENKRQEIRIRRQDVEDRIKDLKKHMLNPANADQTKLLLQSYIERIEIDNNTIKATFKVAFSFCMEDFPYTVSYRHTITERRKALLAAV